MLERTGGCLCRAVRYVVRGEPTHVGRCHFGDCRKESGSTYTIYGHWPRNQFELAGNLATYEGRSFCPTCGASIGTFDDDAEVEIRLGSLDAAPFELAPQTEVWIKRREPWLHEVEGASQHRENRH
jgi:hypothetical protein